MNLQRVIDDTISVIFAAMIFGGVILLYHSSQKKDILKRGIYTYDSSRVHPQDTFFKKLKKVIRKIKQSLE